MQSHSGQTISPFCQQHASRIKDYRNESSTACKVSKECVGNFFDERVFHVPTPSNANKNNSNLDSKLAKYRQKLLSEAFKNMCFMSSAAINPCYEFGQ